MIFRESILDIEINMKFKLNNAKNIGVYLLSFK